MRRRRAERGGSERVEDETGGRGKKERQSDERREGVREEEGKSLSLTGV